MVDAQIVFTDPKKKNAKNAKTFPHRNEHRFKNLSNKILTCVGVVEALNLVRLESCLVSSRAQKNCLAQLCDGSEL